MAQQAAAPDAGASATVAMQAVALTLDTDVVVTPDYPINTKTVKVGDTFTLKTMFDVMQDGYVLIPKGTPGQGTVSYRTGKGAFGKSGKMEVEFNWLLLNGQHIALKGKFRQEGEGNTGATIGTAVAVGVFSVFVTGHSAAITNGQQLHAHTAEPATFQVPANSTRVITGTYVVPAAQTTQAPLPAAGAS